MALQVETSNDEAPRRYVYIQPQYPKNHWRKDTPMAVGHNEGCLEQTHGAFTATFVFDTYLEIFLRFQNVKTKA